MGPAEANATVGQKLYRFDSPDRVPHDLAEFATSFVRDGWSEGLNILNLGQSLADATACATSEMTGI